MGNEPDIQNIDGNFTGKDIVSLDQFTPQDLEIIFRKAELMRSIAVDTKPSTILAGNIVTLLFYEPSSRTFGSFCAASQRLGAGIIPIHDAIHTSSVVKGESLEDTIQTFQSYSNVIVLRHPTIGTAKKAALTAQIPIINAGDGGGEHPTQTIYDMYTIYDMFKRLHDITVLASGDIVHSRTIRSLLNGLSLYKDNTAYLLSPEALRLDRKNLDKYSKRGLKIVEIFDEKEIPKTADVWYWNRIQKERFSSEKEAAKFEGKFRLTEALLHSYGKKDMIILDPLPRVGEIEERVDRDPRAIYLRKQMRNGMYVRMALLSLVLGKI